MRDFRGVDVWRKAHQIALDVYRGSDALPKIEVFGITIQLRRAAIAVPTRIADGCGREGDAEFAAQLHKARAASSELEYLLLLCRDLGYLTSEAYEALREDVVTVRKMLSGLLRRM
ncbi:MAG: four helix bundle protein [Acidobacteriaceae bacterium]|jgi:four helix bundle protein